MSEYTLVLRIPQAGNKEISYSINLSLPVEAELYEDVFSVAVEKYGLTEADAERLA